ncbi:MAG: hypothetical protein U0744_03105 [Gemmataceae bacterium]
MKSKSARRSTCPNTRSPAQAAPTRKFSDADVEAEEKTFRQLRPTHPKEGASTRATSSSSIWSRSSAIQKVGEAKELTLAWTTRLPSKMPLYKFGEQTVDKAGDKKTVEMQMTEAVANEALRGQTVQATFDVKDVKSLRLPELTEEFLITNFGVPTLDQFREKIRLFLERRLEYNQRQSAREQVLSHISASATWDLPRDMLMRVQAEGPAALPCDRNEGSGHVEEEISGRRRLLERDVLNNPALALKEHFVLEDRRDRRSRSTKIRPRSNASPT